MNSKCKYFKMALLIGDFSCVLLGIVFLCQIMVQKAELEALSSAEETTSKIILELEEENRSLHKESTKLLTDIEYYLKEEEMICEKIHDVEDEYAELEKKYNLKLYIDVTASGLDKENGNTNYLAKYFRIEKEELQAIINESDISEELKADFPVGEEFGLLLPIGEQVWVRYDDIDNLPIGLVIQNPTMDVGYKDIRSGMKLDYEIDSSNAETKQFNFGQVRYVLYEDNDYYYYVEIDNFIYGTILYIAQK